MSAEAKAFTVRELVVINGLSPTVMCNGDRLRATALQRERFLDGCAATLLFYRGGPWDAAMQEEWAKLTEGRPATTKGLCDFIRHCVEIKP